MLEDYVVGIYYVTDAFEREVSQDRENPGELVSGHSTEEGRLDGIDVRGLLAAVLAIVVHTRKLGDFYLA